MFLMSQYAILLCLQDIIQGNKKSWLSEQYEELQYYVDQIVR